ncbi:MAG: hypothetical protein KDA42_18015, partial [Planctomycetales bacterium]|nr:hypothetical protein [Planctomycetales bacterium]
MKDSFVLNWWNRLYARHGGKLWLGQAVLIFAVGFVVAWSTSGKLGPADNNLAVTPTSKASGPSMWTCSMHPQIRSATPGDCPICGMDLIPVATQTGGMRTLTLSPESCALMSIASVPADRKYVSHEIPLVGKVD